MLQRPTFSSAYRAQVQDDGSVVLLDETGYVVLGGRICTLLTPLLDGNRTADDIVAALDGEAPAAEVYYTLMLMEQAGYITEGAGKAPPEAAAFWARLGVAARDAEARLRERAVAVTALEGLAPDAFAGLLRAMRVQVADEAGREAAALEVVLTDDYLYPGLGAVNRRALAAGRPWLLVKPAGTTVWIGPLFSPGETGCWACLAQRLRANRPADVLVRDNQDAALHPAAAPPSLASTTQTALGLAATETVKWIVGAGDQRLAGRLLSFDTLTLAQAEHVLTRRPQCPACGHPATAASTPIILKSRKKTYTFDGGHRVRHPQETFDRHGHHVSPITGIVRSLKPVPVAGTDLVHSYTAGHATHLGGVSLRSLRHNARDRSGGKGMTDLQARASGLCEALERYSGVFQGDEARSKARSVDLGEAAVLLPSCLLFSDHQYENREAWNAKQSGYFQHVPEPFDETAEIDWTPVWSLTNEAVRYLPTAYCYFGFEGPGAQFCRADSNGLAAGNCLEEALLQGFMELAERDAVSLWWYNRTRHPAVDLLSFGESYIESLLVYYRTLGREVWALDVTSDLAIPAFVAVSRRTDGSTEDILMGFGAHFDARIAVLRALTEVNQSLPAVLRSPEERAAQLLPDFATVIDWWNTATLANQPHLAPDNQHPLKNASAYPRPTSDDLKDDVLRCVEIARQHGLEVLALDQTRPDVGLPVVKVFVPGLRHFWKRLAPGRLYDVPVSLGRLPHPLAEDALNPIPLFL